MAILSRGAVFAAAPITRDVEVAEWGGSIRLRPDTPRSRILMLDAITTNEEAVSSYERDQALPEDEREGLEKVDRYDVGTMRIIFAAIDENDDLLFTPDDHEKFRDLPYATLARLYTAVAEINEIQPVSFTDQKKSSD